MRAAFDRCSIRFRRLMNSNDVLRDEYPGDAAWQRFVGVFRPAWNDIEDKGSYLEALKDEDLAVVLAVSMGSEATTWFNRACPALSGYSPSNVLSTYSSGLKVIRTLLMRMPR
jgi:hypothetical protein